MSNLISYSYSLSGNTTYQGFPYPGMGKVGDSEYIRVHSLGMFLYAANPADSCYWDAFNAPLLFGHLGNLGYGFYGNVLNIPGPFDLPAGAYLGWTYNGNDAGTIGKAWAIYEILTVPNNYPTAAAVAAATAEASADKCGWLGKVLGEC